MGVLNSEKQKLQKNASDEKHTCEIKNTCKFIKLQFKRKKKMGKLRKHIYPNK